MNNPLVQFIILGNSYLSITDRIQPVFNDLNPAHVTFELLNKQTLSIQFKVEGKEKAEIEVR